MNPLPIAPREFNCLLARRHLGRLSTSEVIGWAVEKLIEGHDTPGLCILAGLSENDPREVEDCFRRALRELNAPTSEKSDCLLDYAEILANRLLLDSTSAVQAFWQVWEIVRALNYPLELRHWAQTEVDLDVIEYEGTASPEQVNNLICRAAERFLAVMAARRRTGNFRFEPAGSLVRLTQAVQAVTAIPANDRAELFRLHLRQTDLSDLTLPRLFVGRSELNSVWFTNTAFDGAELCWNNFNRCDFSHASLRNADLRRSVFTECSFFKADLSGADLRGVEFTHCQFQGARFGGARLERWLGISAELRRRQLGLAAEQAAEVRWVSWRGKEPAGG